MNTTICITMIMGVAFIAGCATDSGATPDTQIVEISMAASQRNAGEIASATLASLGNETSIAVFVSGVPSSVSRPVRLYTYIFPGTCAHPSATPAFELNQTVTTYHRDGGWKLTKTAPVALKILRSSDYSITLRTSPPDGSFDIFCGNIK